MKRLMVGLVMLFSVSVYAGDFDTILSLPNARVTQCLDLKSLSTGTGADSSVLMYKQGLVALNVCGVNVNNSLYGGFSISTNISKWSFLNVNYAWEGLIDTDIAIWIGMNLKDQVTTYGLNASLIKFEK